MKVLRLNVMICRIQLKTSPLASVRLCSLTIIWTRVQLNILYLSAESFKEKTKQNKKHTILSRAALAQNWVQLQ